MSMAPVAPDSGKIKIEEEGGEERGGEGRCGVLAHRVGGEECEVRAAMTGPIYTPAMSVLAVRYFLAYRAHRGVHMCLIPLGRFVTVRACPRVQLGELGLIHGGMAR